MSKDKKRELDALDWAETTFKDIAHEERWRSGGLDTGTHAYSKSNIERYTTKGTKRIFRDLEIVKEPLSSCRTLRGQVMADAQG